MKKFYCANCGKEIDSIIGAVMFRDNYLLVKYFDDYKCSELPLDDDELEEEKEDEAD